MKKQHAVMLGLLLLLTVGAVRFGKIRLEEKKARARIVALIKEFGTLTSVMDIVDLINKNAGKEVVGFTSKNGEITVYPVSNLSLDSDNLKKLQEFIEISGFRIADDEISKFPDATESLKAKTELFKKYKTADFVEEAHKQYKRKNK